MRWLDGITESMDMSVSKFWEIVKDMEAFHGAVHGFTKSQKGLSDWTATKTFTLLLTARIISTDFVYNRYRNYFVV